MNKNAYGLVYKYAKKFAKNTNDIDDIAQESFLLFVRNPVNGELPKKFYFKLAQRGAYHYYFKYFQKTKRTESRFQDVLFTTTEDQDSFINDLVDDNINIEKHYMYSEIQNKLLNVTGITKSESELLVKILKGYEPEYEDRTHFANLSKKLIAFFN